MILALSKQLLEANRFTQAADWESARRLTTRTFEIKGKTLGVIGMGNTGQALAHRANAFEMNNIYNDIREIETSMLVGLNTKPVGKDILLESADIVSVNTGVSTTPAAA